MMQQKGVASPNQDTLGFSFLYEFHLVSCTFPSESDNNYFN